MANFKISDLRYSYKWASTPSDNNSKKILFHDSCELDIEEGDEVLPFINSYMGLKNFAMLTTFQKIEKALKEELPKTKRGHCKIKRWLSENYFF